MTLIANDSSEVTKLVEEQTGMARSSQLILLNQSLWDGAETGMFPATDVNRPLFLFNRENNNISYTKDTASRK